MSRYEHQVFKVRLVRNKKNCYLTVKVGQRSWKNIDSLEDGWEFVSLIREQAVCSRKESQRQCQLGLFRRLLDQDVTKNHQRPYRWAQKRGRACA